MSIRAVDPARSRIVLVGTPRYADERLPDVPVVANNVSDLLTALTDREVGGFDREHCVVAPQGADVATVGGLLIRAAAQAEDLLLFYYSGHGLLGRRGELYLSLEGTRRDELAFTALPFEAIRDACLESPATSRVVILDSCFSGRAIGETLSDDDDAVAGQLEVSGTYTLASAPGNRTALILPGEQHTAFTERLLHLLHEGSPQFGPVISLGDIYRHLHRRLSSEGLPTPQQRGTATADLLGLVRNRQTATGPTPGAASASPTIPAQSAPLLYGEELAAVKAYAAAVERRGSAAEVGAALAAMPLKDAAPRLQRLSNHRALAVIQAMQPAAAAAVLAAFEPGTAAPILNELDAAKAATLLEHLKPIQVGAVLTGLDPARVGALLAPMDRPLLLAAVRGMDPAAADDALRHVPPEVVAEAVEGMSPQRIRTILDGMPAMAARKVFVRLEDPIVGAVAAATEPQRYAEIRAAIDPKERVFDVVRAEQLRPWAWAATICCSALTAATVAVTVAAIGGWIPWQWMLLAIPEGLLAAVCITICRMPVDRIAYPIVGILGYGGSAVALGLIPTDLPGGALVGASLGLLIVAYLTTAIGFKSETDLVPIMPRTLPDVPTGVSESG